MDTIVIDARAVLTPLRGVLPLPALPQAADGRCYYIRKGGTLTCAERGLGWDAWCKWCQYGPSDDVAAVWPTLQTEPVRHADYPHEDRCLCDCTGCERPCNGTRADGHRAGCVGAHEEGGGA